jgi:hypothetical protein
MSLRHLIQIGIQRLDQDLPIGLARREASAMANNRRQRSASSRTVRTIVSLIPCGMSAVGGDVGASAWAGVASPFHGIRSTPRDAGLALHVDRLRLLSVETQLHPYVNT